MQEAKIADSGSESPGASMSFGRVETSMFSFTVRKKRSRTYKVKRIWKVPSYINMNGLRMSLSDSDASYSRTSTTLLERNGFLCESEEEAVYALGLNDHTCRGPGGLVKDLQSEEESLVWGFPLVSIPAK